MIIFGSTARLGSEDLEPGSTAAGPDTNSEFWVLQVERFIESTGGEGSDKAARAVLEDRLAPTGS